MKKANIFEGCKQFYHCSGALEKSFINLESIQELL
jgi:hypothetical protein